MDVNLTDLLNSPRAEAQVESNTKVYGIYIQGGPTLKNMRSLNEILPRKITLPCGNFMWLSGSSDLAKHGFGDIPCECGAPYKHYFLKWERPAQV